VGRGGAGFLRLAPMALLFAALSVACGGGGGGGSPSEPLPSPTVSPTPSATPTPSPTPTPTPGGGVTFTASSAGPGIVLAQGAGTSSSSLTVDVRAAQVTGLYGIAFDLDYPSAAVRYASATAGTFLGTSGQFSMQVVESTPGHLVVGATRLGTLAGVDGSGLILSLVFTPVANGSGPFAFSRNTAYRSDGATLALPWAGGTVTVAQ